MVYASGRILINFNEQAAASKRLGEFQKHEGHHGLSKEQLKEVWELCVKAAKKDSSFPKQDLSQE